MADSDIVKQQAREWVDRLNSGAGLEGAWRLQRIEKRSRVAVEGETARELPVRIRRFAKGIPVNYVDEAIRYLISIAPYEDIVYNGTRMEGAYSPTRTWWERDDQAVVDRGQMRENTYTIYQDLIDRDHADHEEFGAGGNCSEEVSMRYEYDTFTIEDVPSGDVGRTVSIQAISRNEDGTFNYAVVTRTAKTAVGEIQVVKCDEYQTVTQQSYQNMYAGPYGKYYTGRYGDEGVAEVSPPLPEPCEDKETGTLIEVQVRKNDDCTYDATVTKTVAKTDGNPAEVTKQKTLRGVTETVTQRNVTDDSVVVTKIGDRVQVERNPDGTVNRSDTHAVLEPVGDIGSQCSKTIFEHEHSDIENVADRPSKEATEAGGGVIHEVSARATEEGTWDVTDKVTTEQPVTSAQHIKRKTLRGVTETIVDRNVTNDTVEVTNVGDEVRVEKTPGGLVNRTETSIDKTAEDIDLGDQCQKTVFEHQQRKDTVVPNKPADVHADDAGGGKTYQRTLRQTEEGSWEVSDVTTEELAKEDAQVTKQKTLRGVTTTTVDRNVTDGTVSVTNVGDRVSVEVTPGGRYVRTETTVDKTAEDIDLGDQCQKTVFEHQQRKDTVVATKPSDIHADDAGDGKTHQRTLRQTEEGSWEVSDVETVELENAGAQHSKQKTLRGVTETTVDRNVSNADVEVTNVGDRISVEMTPGGRYNRTVTRVDKTAEDIDLGDQCQKTVFEHQQRKDTVVPNKPADVHADDAGGGKTYQRTLRQTEEGSWEVSDVTTEEIEVPSAVHSKRKTLRGVTETTVDRNVDDSDVTVTNIGDEVRVEKTPGGKYNRTVTTASHDPVGTIGKSDTPSVFRDIAEETDNVPAVTGSDYTGSYVCGGGALVSKSVRVTEEGTWDRNVRTETPIARSWIDPDVDTNYLFSRVYRFRNMTRGQVDSLASEVNRFVDWKLCEYRKAGRAPASHSVNTSSELEDNGLFNGTVSVSISWAVDSSGQYGDTGDTGGKKGIITEKFVWKTFSLMSKFMANNGPAPVVTTWHPRDWYFVMIQTHLRLSGYGKDVLDGLLHSGDSYYVISAVQFDYDETTDKWRYEAVVDQHESTHYDSGFPGPDVNIYAHDINKRYGLPGTGKTLFDTELSGSVTSFLSTYVDPYVKTDDERMHPPSSDPGTPVPDALYPDTCGGS